MKSLTGTWALVRFTLRRDRLLLPLWVAAVSVVPLATVSGFRTLYPTEEALVTAAEGLGTNPAFRAMFGPVYAPNLGALVAWRASIALVIIAVISLLTVIRHTRVEEDSGRRELVGSTVVGRHAPLTAALIVVVLGDLAVGVVAAAGVMAQGLAVTGSIAFGIQLAAAGIVFAIVGALAAQLTEGAGAARDIGLSVVGFAYALRAAGDAGDTAWLSWVSPIGWVQRLRPFAAEQWWVLLLVAVLGGVVVVGAYALASRRDVGGGVLRPRPGPAVAGPRLGSPLGLAWRIHRGLLYGWTAGLIALGGIYGSVAQGVGDLLKDNPDLARIFERMGGTSATIIDMYLSGVIGVLALFAAAYAVQAALRLRVEEEAQRVEQVLATAVRRPRWTIAHLTFAFGGPAVAMAGAGLGVGITYGAITGDLGGQVPRVLAAALGRLPAVWLLAAIVVALFGVRPRLSSFGWAVYGAVVFITFIGAILQLGQWFMDLSPFTHIPNLPGGEVLALPLVALIAIAASLAAVGVAGFTRGGLG